MCSKKLWIFFWAGCFFSCGAPADSVNGVEPALGSAHAIAAEGTIQNGRIIAPDFPTDSSLFEKSLKPYILRQLEYSIGILNGLGGAPELHKARIYAIKKVGQVENRLAEYSYQTEMRVVLDNHQQDDSTLPASLALVLPKQVDPEGLSRFYALYSQDCVSNPFVHHSVNSFWFYYRPNHYYCPLKDQVDVSGFENTVRLEMELTPSASNTKVSYPEYDQLYKDNKLVVTAIFTMVGGVMGEGGTEAYNFTFQRLRDAFGQPTFINDQSILSLGSVDENTPIIEAHFNMPMGKLETHLFMLRSLEYPSHRPGDGLENFNALYNDLTQTSDVVLFNSHANYGLTNQKFATMGTVAPEQYQIFLINTCISFVYGADPLRKVHHDININTSNPDGYFDLVVNAMPAPGHEIGFVNLALIKGLASGVASYQQIFGEMTRDQKVVVLYDTDNTFRP